MLFVLSGVSYKSIPTFSVTADRTVFSHPMLSWESFCSYLFMYSLPPINQEPVKFCQNATLVSGQDQQKLSRVVLIKRLCILPLSPVFTLRHNTIKHKQFNNFKTSSRLYYKVYLYIFSLYILLLWSTVPYMQQS